MSINSNRDERRASLTDMWSRTAAALLRALDSDAPSAAVLEAARRFMADNSTTLDAIRSWQANPLGMAASQLPRFEDDPNEDFGQAATADPLRHVPDFHDDNT